MAATSPMKKIHSKLRDIFLEEKIITCLNEEAYYSYLSQVQKKDIKSVWE